MSEARATHRRVERLELARRPGGVADDEVALGRGLLLAAARLVREEGVAEAGDRVGLCAINQ